MEKKELRRLIKDKRKGIDRETKVQFDKRMKKALFDMDEYKKSENIFIYVSMGEEIETHEIIERALNEGKKVFVPKTDSSSRTMYAIRINSLDELNPVPPFGILEPEFKDEADENEGIDLIITPGLAFSENGDRLGYGAGYYDKFINNTSKSIKVALAYEFQIFASIPTDEHDEKVDIIISEKRLIKVK